MKEIKFTGTFDDVQKRAAEWKAANPHVKIINEKPAVRADFEDHQDAFQKTDWCLTIEYEDPPSN